MLAFDTVPMLAPSLGAQQLDGEGVLFFDDHQFSIHATRAVSVVAELVDGVRSKAEVIEQAGRQVGDLEALSAFQQLEASGKVVRAWANVQAESIAFWHALAAPLPDGVKRLGSARVTVLGLGKETRELSVRLASALRAAGIGAAEVGSGEPLAAAAPADLEVWLVDDYLRPELDALNRRHLEAKTSWVMLSVWSATSMFGPFFEPNSGPCWACLAYRLRINRPIDEYFRRVQRRSEPLRRPHAAIPASEQLMFHAASLAIARRLSGAATQATPAHELLTFDCRAMRLEHHFVPRRPQCGVCGDPEFLRRQAGCRIDLEALHKTSLHDGGYRQFTAQDVVARLQKHVSPYVGAVTHLEPMPDRPAAHAVFVSGYLVTPVEGESLDSCIRVCAGKGRSVDQARASALCEALERRSGEWQGDEARTRSSVKELGSRAVHPQALLCFSEAQYANRARLNAESRHRSQWIPEQLNNSTAIDWTPAWSLTEQVQKFVPFTYCFAGAPVEAGARYCRANGNGVAAGNSVEEAILQALFELVERDAVAVWWYNRVQRPSFQLVAGVDAYCDALLADYTDQGASVQLLDLTHDLKIPVCAAVSERVIAGRSVVSIGFGCHLQPDLAAQRALSELNQIGNGLYPSTREPIFPLPAGDREFLRPSRIIEGTAARLPWRSPDLRTDINECLRRLRELEVLVVDKSRPDFEVHVAQVIVPSLRHFWARLGAGRLYDVPHRLGWLAVPHSEAELNPVPLTL